ncbi:MAG: metallophosphoesterase [Capsulimonadaceae bacterium]
MTTPLKRVAIIGDIHAEDEALSAVLDWLAMSGADSVLCDGDVVDELGDAERCCSLLRAATGGREG